MAAGGHALTGPLRLPLAAPSKPTRLTLRWARHSLGSPPSSACVARPQAPGKRDCLPGESCPPPPHPGGPERWVRGLPCLLPGRRAPRCHLFVFVGEFPTQTPEHLPPVCQPPAVPGPYHGASCTARGGHGQAAASRKLPERPVLTQTGQRPLRARGAARPHCALPAQGDGPQRLILVSEEMKTL